MTYFHKKINRNRTWILPTLILLLAIPHLQAMDIRVLLTKNKSWYFLRSENKVDVTRKDGTHIIYIDAGQIFRVTPSGDKIKVGINGPYTSPLRLKQDGIFHINDRAYRGSLIVHNVNGILTLVNELNLEDYLYGVVPGEVPVNWSKEVIKAQAVVARTFALHQIYNSKKKGIYDLDSTTSSQMYEGFSLEKEHVNRLVDETRGQVLIYKNKLAQTYYHSTCGGQTEDPAFVWGKSLPYLKNVSCPYCKDTPHYEWTKVMTPMELQNALIAKGKDIKVTGIRANQYNSSRRVALLTVKGKKGNSLSIKGSRFREILGYRNLKSLRFTIETRNNQFYFHGKGWGHGVGLCQWGAKGMSDKGINFKRILAFYYRGTSLARFSMNLVQKNP